MHLRAAAASTPSGVPPIPKRMSVPAPGQPVAMAPATSPSVMSRIRAPVERTSLMSVVVARAIEDDRGQVADRAAQSLRASA